MYRLTQIQEAARPGGRERRGLHASAHIGEHPTTRLRAFPPAVGAVPRAAEERQRVDSDRFRSLAAFLLQEEEDDARKRRDHCLYPGPAS
ncbi:hypothetical protein EYF80_027222 [Liparis tanakae]|uniref:Uncharacterized protein n=1 Tax=Liparis tanakae TaxID=230148 RepID=A0A4Z2H9L8_9TELE|nr:hypothetical protein EYF80_027222 [Liparis tanakae]